MSTRTILSVIDATARFPIRFTRLNKAMVVLGAWPRTSYVDVEPDVLIVRMWWWFRATIPRPSITAVTADDARVLGWGVHGWRGSWLVNGSSGGLVRLTIEPPTRARVVGFPVRLRELRVALEDPEGFLAAVV